MHRNARTTLPTIARSREAMAEWLGQWEFDRFITLTFSQPGNGIENSSRKTIVHMRDRLRQFDARMNRCLIGRDWHKRPDNRMFPFFAPEKIGASPHWHGLIGFYKADPAEAARQGEAFDRNIQLIWKKLVPAGTVDAQPITDNEGAIRYAIKSLDCMLNFDHCIVPDEFLNR